MYVNPNFKTKKALKEAVAAREAYEKIKDQIQPLTVGAVLAAKRIPPIVTVFSPGPFPCPQDGSVFIEGPHYPQPHRWYAEVQVKAGRVVSVK